MFSFLSLKSIPIAFIRSFPVISDYLLSSTKNFSSGRLSDELTETGYTKILDDLLSQLPDIVKSNTPRFFENLVVDLLIKVGYGSNKIEFGEVVGKFGDESINVIIK